VKSEVTIYLLDQAPTFAEMNEAITAIKKVTAIGLSFMCGFFVFALWGAGSHGHFNFRPHMTEDWIIISLLLMLWGVPLFLIGRKIVKIFF
jgi:hypothetical protein